MGRKPDQGLTAPQLQAVEGLIQGMSISDIAQQIGVHRTTIHNWLNKQIFQDALDRQRTAIKAGLRARFMGLVDPGFKAIEKALEEGDGNLALKLFEKVGIYRLTISEEISEEYDTSNLSKEEALDLARLVSKVRTKRSGSEDPE
jgi:DNA-binding MarR family transcriptional regulator